MKALKFKRLKLRGRRGVIAVLTGLLLIVILGMVALAFDVGWILMTRTQLQAAADASALAGGTKLIDGLGYQPSLDPGEVVTQGTAIAAEYAAYHPNGNEGSSYADPARDVLFGWATFNSTDGSWNFSTTGQTDTGWFNAIDVTLHRDVAGSTQADYPLPLILAPVLGTDTSSLSATARAVILPARGFVIEPGSDEHASLLPFALYSEFWFKYFRAQDYYKDHEAAVKGWLADNDLANLQTILDPEPIIYADGSSEPLLFGNLETAQNKVDDAADGVEDGYAFRLLFTDKWTANLDPEYSTPVAGSDGFLEMDAYPHDVSAGNFGTIDLGWAGNSTDTLSRQIVDGINEEDLGHLGIEPGDEFSLDAIDSQVTGDTGISVGMKLALDKILGQCRSMLLFSTVSDVGNNTVFQLTGYAGVRIMDVKLDNSGGQEEYKNITIQRCNYVMPGAIGDLDDEIDENTTVFTPLILIK